MWGKSNPAGRRTLGSLLGAGGLGVLIVATATACASTPKTEGAGGSSSVPVVTTSSGAASPSASASASASAGGSPSSGAGQGASGSPTAGAGSSPGNQPMIPAGGPVVTPKAQVSTVPAGKLTPFESAAHSSDGKTLYLALESMGGACGQYDVVVQQSSAKVVVGLVHLTPSGHTMCPQYVTRILIPAQLSAPLGQRAVVDLANNQVVASPVQK